MLFRYVEEKSTELLERLEEYNIPVSLENVCNKLGILLKSENLQDNVSGLFVIKDNVSHIIYSSSESTERQRFTIAHEIGHFILHKDKILFIDKNESVLYRNSESSSGELLKEREANSFAAALLMPKKIVEHELSIIPLNSDVIGHLSDKFKVSSQAMSFRLSNLGYDFGLF